MDIKLKVTCSNGATKVTLGEEVCLSLADGLRAPAQWASSWRRVDRHYGTIEIGGGEVSYSADIMEPEKMKYRVEVIMRAKIDHPAPEATKPHCVMVGSGSGEKVVGTWIAEGGG
jgi:hypothetical protein